MFLESIEEHIHDSCFICSWFLPVILLLLFVVDLKRNQKMFSTSSTKWDNKTTYIVFVIWDRFKGCDDVVKLFNSSLWKCCYLYWFRFHVHISRICIWATFQFLNNCSFHEQFIIFITFCYNSFNVKKDFKTRVHLLFWLNTPKVCLFTAVTSNLCSFGIFSSGSIWRVVSDNDSETWDFWPGYLTIFNFPTSCSLEANEKK